MNIIFLDIDGVLNSHTFRMGSNRTKADIIDDVGFVFDDLSLEEIQEKYIYGGVFETLEMARNHIVHDLWSLDYVSCGIIKRLVLENDAKIVVSSVWRLGNYPLYFEFLFKLMGQGLPEGTVIGCTGRAPTDTDREVGRGTEINMWIEENLYDLPDTDYQYVIIDDDSDFFDDQPLVKTTHEIGLSYIEYEIISKYFETGVISTPDNHKYRLKRMFIESGHIQRFIIWEIDQAGSRAVMTSRMDCCLPHLWIKCSEFAELKQLGMDTSECHFMDQYVVYVEYDFENKIQSYEVLHKK